MTFSLHFNIAYIAFSFGKIFKEYEHESDNELDFLNQKKLEGKPIYI